jgi:hypothetical protein
MDFNGIFMLTGASGLNNPDHIYIDSFAMYDMSEKVSEGHNQHFHEAHKKKAIRDMAQFDHDHHTKDLLHSTNSFFNKNMFGEANLIDMIPEQLSMTKQTKAETLREMSNNFNYYVSITSPLHNHKHFGQQML